MRDAVCMVKETQCTRNTERKRERTSKRERKKRLRERETEM